MTYTICQPVTFDATAVDGFGKQKVSNAFTIADSSHTRGKNPDREQETLTGSATSVYDSDTSSILLSVATSGDEVIRQNRQYCIYQPGKSLNILCTGVLDGGTNASNCTSMIGYFDDENGVFAKYVGDGAGTGTLNFVLRSKTGALGGTKGTAFNLDIAQNAWNGDKMDGTGSSGISIDATKSLIFFFDIEWLGVGAVRCGFVVGGIIYIAHIFKNSNIRDTTYMTSANLPIRYQIVSGTGGGAGTLEQICSSVQSDGGFNPEGTRFSAVRTTGISVSSTLVPLISIRLKGDSFVNARTNIIIKNISTMAATNTDMGIRIYETKAEYSQSLLTGANFVSASSVSKESAVEYDISSTAVNMANSTLIQAQFVADDVNQFSFIPGGLGVIASNIVAAVGDTDIYTVAAIATSGSSTTFAAINWEEIF